MCAEKSPRSRQAPRGRFARVVLACLLGFAFLLLSVVPRVFVEDTTGHRYLGRLAGGILPAASGAWPAPKVDCRRSEALVLLTMGLTAAIGALLFLRIIWPVACLPHRDWLPSQRNRRHPPHRPGPHSLAT